MYNFRTPIIDNPNLLSETCQMKVYYCDVFAGETISLTTYI